MKGLIIAFTVYFAVISLITGIITAADKFNAKRNRRRVPEATLFTLAFIGGSIAEYAVMRLIRHKTLHKRFMIGLPVIILLQLIAVIFIITQTTAF